MIVKLSGVYELEAVKTPLKRGDSGFGVRLVQEWLNLRGLGVKIDGDFGPATEAAVLKFASVKIVDAQVWAELTEPMRRAISMTGSASDPLTDLAVTYAFRHLANKPREVGGQNRGPWVRLYMEGNEGDPWAWCAGFMSFLYHQACVGSGQPGAMPFKRTFSCDDLAAQAKASGRFVTGPDAGSKIAPGTLFLVRKSDTDWVHTGIVTGVSKDHFETIEGNTNDDGSREGYEVCARHRGYTGVDFFKI